MEGCAKHCDLVPETDSKGHQGSAKYGDVASEAGGEMEGRAERGDLAHSASGGFLFWPIQGRGEDGGERQPAASLIKGHMV